jgi:hypothetical protein
MKSKFLVACLVLLTSFFSFSQAQPVSADLSLSSADISNADGSPTDPNELAVSSNYRVTVNIGNIVSQVDVPGGHVRLKIGLGTSFVITPGTNFATLPLSTYFDWSYDLSGSQPQIVGLSKLGVTIPDEFIQPAYFPVTTKPTVGTSTVSFNLLIANPPTTTTPLSDPTPANNVASNIYTISVTTPLPLTLISFNGSNRDCNTVLNWKTLNEEKFKNFEVQVSGDGRTYSSAGAVVGKNSIAGGDYTFAYTQTDKKLFYRLKMIDIDGKYTYSNTVAISSTCNLPKLNIYPNPIIDKQNVIVSLNNFTGKINGVLYDLTGKALQNVTLINGANRINLSIYASGMYWLKVKDAGGNEQSLKVTIAR